VNSSPGLEEESEDYTKILLVKWSKQLRKISLKQNNFDK
jgi:hypothetical protein